MVDRARHVPVWAWLTGIVVASIVFRWWYGRGMIAPFIMVDELIYSDLARSLAAGNGLEVRGEPYLVSLIYPLLLAPVYAIFDSLPDAYAAVKVVNAVVMSLAAVPAYMLARRVLPAGFSLFAALLAVVVPSMVYTGTVMTENAFYPAFLLFAWALVRMLERPTPAAQLLVLGLGAGTVLIRVQAVALLFAALTAPLLLRRSLRPYRLLYGITVGGAALVLLAQVVRGGSLSSLLGAYKVVGETGYDLGEALRFLLWHVAELDLYLGVFPLVAFAVLLTQARKLEPPLQAFLAAATALSVWVLLVVSTFASQFASNRIQERNMFFLAPLFLIALLAWVDRGAARPRPAAIVAAVALGVLPALIPFERFLETGVKSDTLMLLPHLGASGSNRAPPGRRDRPARRPPHRGGLPAAAAALCARAARRRARVLRARVSRDPARTAERARTGRDRRARPGDLGRGRRLDRSRRSRRGRGRSRLDRADRPLHRQPERVLLEERRADLRHRPGGPRLVAGDAGRARS